MDRDYFQEALHTFNGGNWYGWKTHDDSGNKIPNDQRMQYKYIKIIKDGDTAKKNVRTSAINKLKSATYSALTDAEAKALFGE